jgi:2-dehydro-3-deoxyphosphogluconate aldolase/(4S)-4-hydroxy-2-oxoglutarate aldolase
MNDHPALERIRARPLFAVVQTSTADSALRAASAAIAAGIRFVEVPLGTPGAHRVLSELRREHGEAVMVGAGNVVAVDVADRAIKAGAQFVVSPHTSQHLLEMCRGRGVLGIPSALSPSEVLVAWSLGAPLVRVFPASSVGGPAYVRALKASLAGVRLMPAGGVGPEIVVDHFRAGAFSAAVDSGLFPASDIKTSNYTRIAERVRALVRTLDELD